MNLEFKLFKSEAAGFAYSAYQKVIKLEARIVGSGYKISESHGSKGGTLSPVEATANAGLSERDAAIWLGDRIEALEKDGYRLDRGENARPMPMAQYVAIVMGVRSHAIDVLCHATSHLESEGWDYVVGWTDKEIISAAGDADTAEAAIAAIDVTVKVLGWMDRQRNYFEGSHPASG